MVRKTKELQRCGRERFKLGVVVVRDSARELDYVKQTQNGVVGLPRKYLEGKARDMANKRSGSRLRRISFANLWGCPIFEHGRFGGLSRD